MGSVGTPVVRRLIEVARVPESTTELLADVGLASEPGGAGWTGEAVDADVYYGLLERIGGERDLELPFRYGAALRAEDLGALGLAMKTAPTLADALRRLVRYVLVLSDTLEYALVDEPPGAVFALNGRPHHRAGAALANECALAAVVAFLRQASGADVVPAEVCFRHPPPSTDRFHRSYFGSAVTFGAPVDGIRLTEAQLARPTELADDGLSAYLLAQLDELRSRASDRTMLVAVRGAVADALADGVPSKALVARRLGMSERTLHRRLADEGETFQALVAGTRRDAAESLLRADSHNLVEIAFLTGFADQSAFTRAFKRWTGTTPASFRRSAAATP